MTTGRWASPVLLVCSLMAASGCGYSFDSPYRSDVKTVAVDIFDRGTYVYRRGLEMRATEATVKRILEDTPYRIADKDQADTLLTASIEVISQDVLSSNPDTGRPRELEMTLRVAYRWKDLRTGETLTPDSEMTVTGTYIPHEPIGEDFFQGSEDVANRLAKRLVEKMEAPW